MPFELIISGLLLMGLCALFATVFLKSFYDKKYIKALIFKGIASLCFVAFGAANCFYGQFSYIKLIIFIGLCFGIVGDEVIALCQVFPKRDSLAFIGGGVIFIVGHVLYILALFLIGKLSVAVLVMAFAFVITLSAVYEKRRNFLVGDMKRPLVLYLGIVLLVSAVTVSVFCAKGTLGAGLFALGGILFAVSDNILFAYKLGEKPRFLQNVALHVAYYLAQFSIAWSIGLL